MSAIRRHLAFLFMDKKSKFYCQNEQNIFLKIILPHFLLTIDMSVVCHYSVETRAKKITTAKTREKKYI